MNILKKCLIKLIRPNNKYDFLFSLSNNSKILDVGCGDHSSTIFKNINTSFEYYGIDIQLYLMNDADIKAAHKLILTTPELFDSEIAVYKNYFDAVICAHNLEHCNDYEKVVDAILGSLKTNGVAYFSFPSEKTIHLPSRKGTLNFYDDDTHKNLINYENFISKLKKNNFEIVYTRKNYQPIIPYILGFLYEPIGMILKNQLRKFCSTWAYYGFETVVIAKKTI